jgi:Tfp pilus assembly protein PilV
MAVTTEARGASAMALGAEARGASEGGFSLVETIIASSVMIAGVVTLAQLFVMSTRTNVAAKSTSIAAVLAQQKMEQLRSLEWGFDALGLPNTDTTTDTTKVPMSNTGGTGLSPSPAVLTADGNSTTLSKNVVGWVDYIDKYGTSLGGGTTTPPAGASYIRRWSVEPLPTNPNNTIVLQVLVTPTGLRTADDTTVSVRRKDQEARIMSVKTRKAS